MYEIKPVDPNKLRKDIKFNTLFSHIFGIMFIFDILRGFLLSEIFSFLNCIIFLILFCLTCILDKVNRLRLELYNHNLKK